MAEHHILEPQFIQHAGGDFPSVGSVVVLGDVLGSGGDAGATAQGVLHGGMVVKGGMMTTSHATSFPLIRFLKLSMNWAPSAGPMFIFQLAAMMGLRDIME